VNDQNLMLITGTSRGIGSHLAEYYSHKGIQVLGCSRQKSVFHHLNYRHYCLDVSQESDVINMFADIRTIYGRLDILINNAGIAAMNHILVTPMDTVRRIFETNVIASFLFCREAAKIMQKNRFGRIVNFATVATPLRLEGEAAYASSKAAIVSLTQILARELAQHGITVNAVGPTPIKTDLIRSVPEEKMNSLIIRQAIKRYGEFKDVTNVIDFFIRPETEFVTGEVIYLGGL